MRIAIIPARGGSKRIKNKNIIDFLGKPLIAYALDAARDSDLFDKIHVSTDSDEIRNIVEGLGYEVDFLRDATLADDHTGIIPVLKWVHQKYEAIGELYEDICCIMPTAPLLKPNDLKNAFNLYEENNCKSPLLVVAPFPVPVEWAFYRDSNSHLLPRDTKSLIIRSQDIKPSFYETGPFTIHHYSHILNDNPFNNEQYISLLMDKARTVDIDDPNDLELAKILYLGEQSLLKLKND